MVLACLEHSLQRIFKIFVFKHIQLYLKFKSDLEQLFVEYQT